MWTAQTRPYGEVFETTTPDPLSGRTVVTNLRLPGQYDERLLGTLGLQGPYYNWNRWYLPSVGRYLELDPIARAGGFNGFYGPNWYGYAEGNPLKYSDRTGLYPGQMPPPPPLYDPNFWHVGQFDDGTWYLRDPNGRSYTPHAEDKGHWRHWDWRDPPGGGGSGRWPNNSKKPHETQKRKPYGDQCAADPSGDAPEWTPPEGGPTEPFSPLFWVPELPMLIEIPVWVPVFP